MDSIFIIDMNGILIMAAALILMFRLSFRPVAQKQSVRRNSR